MKTTGYIQPQPHTQALWDALVEAKAAKDYVRVGALSAEIRKVTIRGVEDGSDGTE